MASDTVVPSIGTTYASPLASKREGTRKRIRLRVPFADPAYEMAVWESIRRAGRTVESVAESDAHARACRVDHFSLSDLLDAPSRQGRSYAEVLRVQALSAGIYELSAGADDRQKPHSEDEVYVVLRGRAKATVNGQTVAVDTGSLLYVPARAAHHFHDIEDDLTVLVLFAPAETTAAG